MQIERDLLLSFGRAVSELIRHAAYGLVDDGSRLSSHAGERGIKIGLLITSAHGDDADALPRRIAVERNAVARRDLRRPQCVARRNRGVGGGTHGQQRPPIEADDRPGPRRNRAWNAQCAGARLERPAVLAIEAHRCAEHVREHTRRRRPHHATAGKVDVAHRDVVSTGVGGNARGGARMGPCALSRQRAPRHRPGKSGQIGGAAGWQRRRLAAKMQRHCKRRIRVHIAGQNGPYGYIASTPLKFGRRWPGAAHLPAHRLGVGGFCVSSIAHSGIDQTKSADVPMRTSPGAPSTTGGWPVLFQYQVGSSAPSGPIGGSTVMLMKPATDVGLPI